MISLRAVLAVTLLTVGLVPLLSCGSSSPTSVTLPTTAPAVPSPTPTPTPTPTPPVVAASCQGPEPTGTPAGCRKRDNAQLAGQLTAAVDATRGRSDIYYPDGQTIRYLDVLRREVASSLDRMGICAAFDLGGSGDEIYIRTSDARISEAYDVISSKGTARVGYQNTCEPAIPGPGPPEYPVQDPQCSLPPSGASFCLDRSFASEYQGDVRSALATLIEQHPEIFDLGDSKGDLEYKIRDLAAYNAGLVANLRARGYCALPGEEFAVKRDNSVSENFDMVLTPGGSGTSYSLFAYKGRCHNAAF